MKTARQECSSIPPDCVLIESDGIKPWSQAKKVNQPLDITRKIFYSNNDPFHNFSLAYIRTRSILQGIFRNKEAIGMTELDRLFVGALCEGYLAPISFTIRDKYIAKWKYPKQDHILVDPMGVEDDRRHRKSCEDELGTVQDEKEKARLLRNIAEIATRLGAFQKEEWPADAKAPRCDALLKVLQGVDIESLKLDEIFIPMQHPNFPQYQDEVVETDNIAGLILSFFNDDI